MRPLSTGLLIAFLAAPVAAMDGAGTQPDPIHKPGPDVTVSDDQMKAANPAEFAKADRDGNGKLDKDELVVFQNLIDAKKLRDPKGDPPTASPSPTPGPTPPVVAPPPVVPGQPVPPIAAPPQVPPVPPMRPTPPANPAPPSGVLPVPPVSPPEPPSVH